MAAAATDYFTEVGNPGTATTLAAPGHTIAGTTFNVVSTSNWPTTTGVIFAVDTFTTQIVNGVSTAVRTPGSYTEWEGVVASSTQITGAVLRYGTDQNYSAGANTRVYIPVASSQVNRQSQGIRVQHNQDGTHGAVTATSVTASGTITAANFIQSGGANSAGWTVGLATPNTVTALGNRSYSMVFNSTDLTSTVSAGMRLRTQRTVAAPTQCTSLNGTTQYYSKSSPAGMTFTDDFVVSAWVKISAYQNSSIVSRYNGTSGWRLAMGASGQISLEGYNAGSANSNVVQSYQSIPLNKWVHIAAQLDMSTAGVSATTSYVMIDGVDVPSQKITGGTAPTALIQAGNLEIGGWNGGLLPTSGKIGQVAIYSAKVTQATILASMNQTLAGTETSLVSAYSFNNTINDLNTTNANNLTANGSAVATNADSPFGGQADGTISSTLDYAIIQKASFSTNTTLTVQVPEGCTIPTSGGVSAVSYSTQKAPYGMPATRSKWAFDVIGKIIVSQASAVGATWYQVGNLQINVPIGEWALTYWVETHQQGTSGPGDVYSTLATTTAAETDTLATSSTTSTSANIAGLLTKTIYPSLAAATTYYLNSKVGTALAANTLFNRGDTTPTIIRAENSYL